MRIIGTPHFVQSQRSLEALLSAAGQRAAQFSPGAEFANSLPVFGCCARSTAKRLCEMALVGETCLEGDKRNGFLAK